MGGYDSIKLPVCHLQHNFSIILSHSFSKISEQITDVSIAIKMATFFSGRSVILIIN